MNKIISTKVTSADKLCTHRLEIIVEFDEPISFYDAQTIVCNAIGDYMDKQNNEQKQCNTCANATDDFNNEVDTGCYMCSKGYENNYVPIEEQIE